MPGIEGFDRGPVSAEMWEAFQRLVGRCRARKSAAETARQMKYRVPPRRLGGESDYRFRKLRHAHTGEIEKATHAVATRSHEAATELAAMSYLIEPKDKRTADFIFWHALRALVGDTSHEWNTDRWGVIANWERFDAGAELAAGDAATIAKRWIDEATTAERRGENLR